VNWQDINKSKLTHLLADDLFTDDIKQVFCAKTGKWIGTLTNRHYNLIPDEEPTQEPEKPDLNQLSLF
jgi:hypothetical protein